MFLKSWAPALQDLCSRGLGGTRGIDPPLVRTTSEIRPGMWTSDPRADTVLACKGPVPSFHQFTP
jgi:hypothetical protein